MIHNTGIYTVAILVTIWTFTCLFVDGKASSDRISCYNCTTSKHGTDCDDPADPSKLKKFISECESGLDRCAKVVTFGKTPVGEDEDENDEEPYRHTMRVCSRRTKSGCNLLDGTGTTTKECWCKGHLCNSANVMMTSQVTWLVSSVAAMLAGWVSL